MDDDRHIGTREEAIARYRATQRELSRAYDAIASMSHLQRRALERAEGCIKGLLARTPVRDVEETLAEIRTALNPPHTKGVER